jgi:hypothetical protein
MAPSGSLRVALCGNTLRYNKEPLSRTAHYLRKVLSEYSLPASGVAEASGEYSLSAFVTPKPVSEYLRGISALPKPGSEYSPGIF